MKDDRSGAARGWLILVVLMIALIFSQLDRLAMAALIEGIKHDMSLSDRQLGILQGGAFGLFYTVMGLPLGYLADRWSNRGTIILGYTVWSGATILSGLAGSYSHLLAARLGVGAGEAALSPAGYSLIRQNFRPERMSLAISIFQMGSVIGVSSAFAVIGGLQALFVNDAVKPLLPAGFAHWQLTFLVLGLVGLLFLPVLFLLKDKPAQPVGDARVADAATPDRLLPFLKAHVAIWLPLFLGMSGVIVFLYSMMSWLPAVFSREFGWGPTKFGPVFGAIVFVTSAAGILTGGWLTDRINVRSNGRAHLILPLLVCGALLPLVLALAVLTAPWPILIAVGMSVFLAFVPLSVAPTFTQLWAPASLKGQMSAVYILFVNGISLSLAPIAIGFMSDATHMGDYSLRFAITTVAGGMLAISFAMLLFLHQRGKRSDLAADMGGTPSPQGA